MNKHVENEQADRSYQLYGDGTMLIKVDGTYQRRGYSVIRGQFGDQQIEPNTHAGEQVLRTVEGDISIVTGEKPVEVDVGFGNELIHPLARIEQLAQLIKDATRFNVLSGPASNVHVFAHEIEQVVAKLAQEKLAAKPLTVSIDTAEVDAYVQRVTERLHSALHSAQEAGWRAYLDAPMARDMGRSKFNHGVKAAFEHVIAQVLSV